MKITEIPFATLRLQYRIARMPLRFFEERVLPRVDSEARARLLYEHSIGAVDVLIGNILGDSNVKKRGAALVERSEALGEAARLDEQATQTREQADDELRRKRESVAAAPGKARATAQRKVQEARSTAEDRKRQATQTAAKRTAEVKRDAVIGEAAAQRDATIQSALADQAGKTTEFTYDALSRITKVKDALNQDTTYTYN